MRELNMKTTFKYDHYYKYAEIESNLKFFEEKYPDLITVESNCVTKEGRNQYLATITNKKTGDALSKPGWYLDGNIHAGEVTGSMCAMHTIDYLITNYGEDPKATKLIDEMTIYVIPRVTPDGAETYLSTPYTLRSVNRDYYPKDGGVKEEDLDGDGVIRMMRIPTPYGAWKKDPDHEGSMTKRGPSDYEGEFYDVYPEGVFEPYDGDENLKLKKANWGLDFNRNFPYGWMADYATAGAGDYPLSNPECKAIVDFALAHPNIGGAAIGHTSGGIILYPPGTRKASTISSDDLTMLKDIAQMAAEELSYKPLNIFDSFLSDQESYDSGALDDWFFQSLGVPAYTLEFWDLASKAGVPMQWGQEMFGDTAKTLERFNACMKWVKENAPQYYEDWKEFDHPTFGKVEIGGFNYKFTHQNPPENLLIDECEKDTKFNIRFALAMPKLVIDSVCSEEVADGVFKITAVVGNLGYLPTNISDEAIKLNKSEQVKVCIDSDAIIEGKKCAEIGDLSGYSRTRSGVFFYGNISTAMSAPAKKKISWVVKGSKGDKVVIKASQPKAGTASKEVVL